MNYSDQEYCSFCSQKFPKDEMLYFSIGLACKHCLEEAENKENLEDAAKSKEQQPETTPAASLSEKDNS